MNPLLHQWFTPAWAAEELLREFFPDLDASDTVLEPSCGLGAFLRAVPSHITAVGVELDPVLAKQARQATGRQVLTGDFRTVPIDIAPTVVLGNPPFDLKIFDGFLDRARALLPADGRCGFLLPAYALQTHSRVLRWNQHWGLKQSLVPRTIFPRLQLPLVFVMFDRRKTGQLFGFSLYRQTDSVAGMRGWTRAILIHGQSGQPTWKALVKEALIRLGGEAGLPAIYQMIEPHRPSDNRFWQEKVRQTLQQHFKKRRRGVWSVAA